MRLGAVVEGRDDHALLSGIAAPGDDLENREFVRAGNSRGMRHTTTRPTLRLQTIVSNASVTPPTLQCACKAPIANSQFVDWETRVHSQLHLCYPAVSVDGRSWSLMLDEVQGSKWVGSCAVARAAASLKFIADPR